MANKPFEYTIINPLERPTSTDINQLQAQAHYDVRQFADALFGQVAGFLGSSFEAAAEALLDPGKFYMLPGVAFQTGSAENNIGGISGLSDSYEYKALTTSAREITATSPPTTSGWRRYDLLMVRAPTDSERLTNPQNVGIFNPTLGTFGISATSKYKTLTASLDEYTIQEIVQPAVGTDPLVYKSGVAGAYADWTSTPKPTVDSGYLAVAYIQRYEGQTEIVAGDIEDARTLLTVGMESLALLPVSKGGTGNSSTSALTGSVAWYDNATDQIKYTQAVTGLYDTPVSGYLLSSNASGAPTWITPGTPGQVLVSTGTAWEAGTSYRTYSASQATQYTRYLTTYSEVTELALVSKSFNEGIVRVRIQPKDTGVESADPMIFVYNANTSNGYAGYLKFEVTGTAFSKTFIFSASVGTEESDQMELPAFELPVAAGAYTIRVYGKVSNPDTIDRTTLYVQDCTLFASQG